MLEQHGLDEGTSVGFGLAALILSKILISFCHYLFRRAYPGDTESEQKKNNIKLGFAVVIMFSLMCKSKSFLTLQAQCYSKA